MFERLDELAGVFKFPDHMPIGRVEVSVLKAIDEGMQGINRGFDRLSQAAGRIARDCAGGNLTGNLVEVMKARHEVKANARAVRVADETIGTLIDILA